jgi:Amt family ammonium transporter
MVQNVQRKVSMSLACAVALLVVLVWAPRALGKESPQNATTEDVAAGAEQQDGSTSPTDEAWIEESSSAPQTPEQLAVPASLQPDAPATIQEAPEAPAATANPINSGDTAWVLACSALVLLMTPGLGFFYAGMIGARNAVNTLLMTFVSIAVAGFLWVIVGYSLAFSPGDSFIGDLRWAGLLGVGSEPNPDYAASIPHLLFMLFQSKFAVIAPALIIGSVAGRIKFVSWLAFAGLWSLIVYVPVAHWVWSTTGWIRASGSIDFAGGLVVHITAGVAALVLAAVVGKSSTFAQGQPHRPYNPAFVALGTGLLAFGWLGFNAGSALSAGSLASLAAANTFFASASALAVWLVLEIAVKGRPTLVGSCIGTVVGLVGITPAAGFVTVASALLIGGTAALCSFFAMDLVKKVAKIDDTLDVFAGHGVGGFVGALLTAVFASKIANPGGVDGLLRGNVDLFTNQVIDTFAVVVYTAVATFAIAHVVRLALGLRVSEEIETSGMDLAYHQETVTEGASEPLAHNVARLVEAQGKETVQESAVADQTTDQTTDQTPRDVSPTA